MKRRPLQESRHLPSHSFWDNYQTGHFAVNDYAAGERIMHRIVVDGPAFRRD